MRILVSTFVVVIVVAVGGLCFNFADAESGRGALWRVVQACVLNHRVTGSAFPCLAVDLTQGPERGYAVLRSPMDDVRVIVTPTVRTIGLEAARLRGADAPNYFYDAWMSRHFATDDLATKPADDDIALAVNSKLSRSQDQLHVHVACIEPHVKQVVDREIGSIIASPWTRRLRVLPDAPLYRAQFIPAADLAKVNIFDLVAEGLRLKPDGLGEVTIVVVSNRASGPRPAGFTILARRRIPRSADEPHGEALLDQSCERVRSP